MMRSCIIMLPVCRGASQSFFFFLAPCTKYVTNQVRISENQIKALAAVCVCKIGLFHGCRAKAQQPRTSGLAYCFILPVKYAPEAGDHQVNDLLSVQHTVTEQSPPTHHQNQQKRLSGCYFIVCVLCE